MFLYKIKYRIIGNYVSEKVTNYVVANSYDDAINRIKDYCKKHNCALLCVKSIKCLTSISNIISLEEFI